MNNMTHTSLRPDKTYNVDGVENKLKRMIYLPWIKQLHRDMSEKLLFDSHENVSVCNGHVRLSGGKKLNIVIFSDTINIMSNFA